MWVARLRAQVSIQDVPDISQIIGHILSLILCCRLLVLAFRSLLPSAFGARLRFGLSLDLGRCLPAVRVAIVTVRRLVTGFDVNIALRAGMAVVVLVAMVVFVVILVPFEVMASVLFVLSAALVFTAVVVVVPVSIMFIMVYMTPVGVLPALAVLMGVVVAIVVDAGCHRNHCNEH